MKAKVKIKESPNQSATVTESTETPPEVQEVPTVSDNGKNEKLFDLFLARVGQVDTVHTVQKNVRKMFEVAFDEAVLALDVFEAKTNNH